MFSSWSYQLSRWILRYSKNTYVCSIHIITKNLLNQSASNQYQQYFLSERYLTFKLGTYNLQTRNILIYLFYKVHIIRLLITRWLQYIIYQRQFINTLYYIMRISNMNYDKNINSYKYNRNIFLLLWIMQLCNF